MHKYISNKLRRASCLLFISLALAACKKQENPTVPPVVPVVEVGSAPTISTVKGWLVDKAATDETAALFYNLKKIAKTNVLFGHQDDTKRGVSDAATQWANEQQFTGVPTEKSDVKALVGAYPAVYGHDFLHIANFASDPWFDYEQSIARKLTIEAYNRGGINTYCWHYANPVSKHSFYWTDAPVEAVSQILPGGAQHETYRRSLKTIAD